MRLAWLAVAAPGLVALAIVSGLTDRWVPLTGLVLFLPLLHLPAWSGIVVGIRAKARALTATAAAVIVAHLILVVPQLPSRSASSPPADAPRITVVTTNALSTNIEPDAFAAALLTVDADVVIIHELSYEIELAVDTAGVPARFPFEQRANDRLSGSAVFSRLPLHDVEVLRTGHPWITAGVDVGAERVTIVGIHTVSPTTGSTASWRESFATVDDHLAALDGPVVLAGDWNATTAHGPLRDLLAGPLRDAHQDRGRGHARTWPANGRLPPFALLDRVLVSPEVAVASVAERTMPGSDHRAVVVELTVTGDNRSGTGA